MLFRAWSAGPDPDHETQALVVVVYLRSLHGVCLLGSRWLWVVVVLSVAGLRV